MVCVFFFTGGKDCDEVDIGLSRNLDYSPVKRSALVTKSTMRLQRQNQSLRMFGPVHIRKIDRRAEDRLHSDSIRHARFIDKVFLNQNDTKQQRHRDDKHIRSKLRGLRKPFHVLTPYFEDQRQRAKGRRGEGSATRDDGGKTTR